METQFGVTCLQRGLQQLLRPRAAGHLKRPLTCTQTGQHTCGQGPRTRHGETEAIRTAHGVRLEPRGHPWGRSDSTVCSRLRASSHDRGHAPCEENASQPEVLRPQTSLSASCSLVRAAGGRGRERAGLWGQRWEQPPREEQPEQRGSRACGAVGLGRGQKRSDTSTFFRKYSMCLETSGQAGRRAGVGGEGYGL